MAEAAQILLANWDTPKHNVYLTNSPPDNYHAIEPERVELGTTSVN